MNYTWKELFNFFKDLFNAIKSKLKMKYLLKGALFYFICFLLMTIPTLIGIVLLLVLNNGVGSALFMISLIINVFYAIYLEEIINDIYKKYLF